MNQIELDAREVSPTFGLGVGIQCMGLWLHGGDPLRPLRYAELAAQLSRKSPAAAQRHRLAVGS